jgi:hypothetical protein
MSTVVTMVQPTIKGEVVVVQYDPAHKQTQMRPTGIFHPRKWWKDRGYRWEPRTAQDWN